MNLTPAQLASLKTNIANNTATVTYQGTPTPINEVPNNDDGNIAIAAWYNLAASPSFKVYRTSVPMSEIMLNGFDWTRVDNLSVGKARIWDWMVNADPGSQSIDPSKANIRAGINAVWVGTAADLAVRAAVYLHCFRDATNAEKMFATGAGTVADQTGEGPATMSLTAEGNLSYQEVSTARNLP
jgi:hypothetical protein